MKTIKDLSKLTGRVYVYMASDEIAKRFMMDAEKEGFTFPDKAKPTERHIDRIIAINKDNTINYVGFIGHMAYGSGTKNIGNNQLIRINYYDYINCAGGLN